MPSKELVRKIHQLAVLDVIGGRWIRMFDYLLNQHWGAKFPERVVRMALTNDGWIEITLQDTPTHFIPDMESAPNFRAALADLVALAGLTRGEVDELSAILEKKIAGWKRHNQYYKGRNPMY